MEIESLLTVPAVLLSVEVIKHLGLTKRYIPLTAVVCGVLFGFIYGDPITGAVLGLTASGVYSGAKAVSGK